MNIRIVGILARVSGKVNGIDEYSKDFFLEGDDVKIALLNYTLDNSTEEKLIEKAIKIVFKKTGLSFLKNVGDIDNYWDSLEIFNATNDTWETIIAI